MQTRFIAAALAILAPALASGQENGPVALKMEAAVARALEHNPGLAAYPYEVRAAEARELQARLRPNPELTLEIEDIALNDQETSARTLSVGPGAAAEVGRGKEKAEGSAFREAEFTIAITQLFELGGKRAHRVAAAAAEKEIARWDYEVARANVLEQTAQRFIEVLVAQERLALSRDLQALAAEVEQSTSGRVEAGRVSPLELNRAQMRQAAARAEVRQAQAGLETARARLSEMWGEPMPAFEAAEGDLPVPPPPPLPDKLDRLVATMPELQRWNAEIERRHRLVELARANRTPDIAATAGWRVLGRPESTVRGFALGTDGPVWSRERISPDSDYAHSLVAGLSVPLPLFNRNQGAVEEASQLAAQAESQMNAAALAAQAELINLHHQLAAEYAGYSTRQDEILPKAQETFNGIQEGYRQGKFSLLDVLDAEQTLFEVRRELLEATERYWTTRIAIERRTAPKDFESGSEE